MSFFKTRSNNYFLFALLVYLPTKQSCFPLPNIPSLRSQFKSPLSYIRCLASPQIKTKFA